MNVRFDVAIAGGGMVGAALALALGRQGMRVAVLERHAPQRQWPPGEIANRVSALSRASQRILEHLAAWPRMVELGVSPYEAMYVWDAGGHGHIRFDAADLGEPDLGHIVENRVIRLALWEGLEALDTVEILCPAEIRDFHLQGEDAMRIHLAEGPPLDAALLAAADGRDSWVRERAGIPTQGWGYDQQALVANVVHERPHQATAWQRFLPTGPLAFLPLADGRSSIVWSTSPQHARELLEMEAEAFHAALGAAFEYRLGEITASGPRAAFPLRLQHATRYIAPRLALVGDAAHAIHPLAGQGVNLGLLDAAQLAETLTATRYRHRDLGGEPALRRYERARKGDNLAMLAAMDLFKRLFGNDLPPLRLARNLGLDLADRAGPLKHLLIRRAMGLAGDLPALARPSRPPVREG